MNERNDAGERIHHCCDCFSLQRGSGKLAASDYPEVLPVKSWDVPIELSTDSVRLKLKQR
jgi:hypothetical protein